MTDPRPNQPVASPQFQPKLLIPIVTAGFVVAIYEVIAAVSMAALIFSGELADNVASGIGLALFSGAVTGAAVALLGSLPGTIGGVQDAPAAIMAFIAAAIVASMPPEASADEKFMTVVAAMAITTLLTGASLLAIGHFRLGNLVRFLPYPVIGGFLAGTGWLLFSGAITMTSGLSLTPSNLSEILEPDVLLAWLPGLLWAVLAFFATRRLEHPFLLPGLIAAGILLFYGAAWLGNATIAQLGEQGLLLGPMPDGQLWQPPSVAAVELVSWPAVFAQAPSIGAIVILSMVGVLLNATGLEVSFDKDVKLNRELRAAGVGNVLSGVGTGMVGFQQLSGSALSLGLKAASRWVGVIAAAACASFLIFGGSALPLFPKGILGGLLIFVGLSFLYDWLVAAWSRLPHQDYAIVVIILLTTAVIGFLEAVLLGLLIAVILFVISYSRAEIVRAEMSGVTYHSRVARTRRQRHLLDQAGEALCILKLQGFIFFGTASGINDRLQQRIDEPSKTRPRFVILDFERVTGLDSTATLSFAKLVQRAAKQGVRLAISSPGSAIWRQLLQAGLCEPGSGFQFFSSLDKGVEWCENQLLEALDSDGGKAQKTLPERLSEIVGDSVEPAGIMKYLERMEVEPGRRLMAEGDPADTLYFVESGQVTAQITQEDGRSIRLQTMGGGHVVGEIGFYLGGQRTADVVADEASVLYSLSLSDLKRMQAADPAAASTLHRLIAILLAERITHLTAVIEAEEKR